MARSSQGLDGRTSLGRLPVAKAVSPRQVTVLSLVIQGRVLKACVHGCGVPSSAGMPVVPSFPGVLQSPLTY